jgi:small multidrug resistance pump
VTALLLAAAIVSEVVATVCLKASDGFSRPIPSAITVVGYLISFWLLALVLKELSVGTTYAIWSAVGTAAVALIGIAAYGESASLLKIASLGLIVLGVIGLNAAGAH